MGAWPTGPVGKLSISSAHDPGKTGEKLYGELWVGECQLMQAKELRVPGTLCHIPSLRGASKPDSSCPHYTAAVDLACSVTPAEKGVLAALGGQRHQELTWTMPVFSPPLSLTGSCFQSSLSLLLPSLPGGAPLSDFPGVPS